MTEFEQAKKEFPGFENFVWNLNGAFKVGVFRLEDYHFEDRFIGKSVTKEQILEKQRPQLVLFPNKLTGVKKLNSAKRIKFNPKKK
mmetsp:Transcript_10290/g.15713  ORF Transcript_10290/g.15713 Transcript_10290/m.15713 type:complete len:86 (+) Transcript_10290:1091-1348(+)